MRADSPPAGAGIPVIFGTGGSGTRAFADIAQRAGFFMGTALTRAKDSEHLVAFFHEWVNRYLLESHWVDTVLEGGSSFGEASPEMERAFTDAVAGHRGALEDESAPWGWKGPRSMYVLPFLHRRYPEMRAIHVVRDGRDMAYAKNQGQLRLHAGHVLTEDQMRLPDRVRSITLWSRINLAAATYGERVLAGSYLRVRFEDLCSDPPATVAGILEYLGRDASGADASAIAAESVRPPPTINRWQAEDPAEIEAVSLAGRQVLERFGYL